MRKIKTGKPLSERESESLTTYLDEIGRAKLLSEEEERELSEKIKNGDARALDKLTTANLKLVVSIAKHYQDRGVGMNDLVSEGNIGLMKAARNYDGARGTRFAQTAFRISLLNQRLRLDIIKKTCMLFSLFVRNADIKHSVCE